MEKKLYYCNYWQKKNISSYSYCLSDLIYQNEYDLSLAQIHGIILYKNSILTLKKEQLSVFEEEVRKVIRNVCKASIIKIWYYKEDNTEFDIEHIPSRFAITIHFSDSINKEKLSFLCELEKCIINLIKSIMN